MKRIIYLLLITALLWPADTVAQRRNRRSTAQQPRQQVVTEDPRITQMLASTQQIMFIDSIVVDYSDFMKYIPLTRECGSVEQVKGNNGRFTNELGDIRYEAVCQNDSISQLYTSSFIANEWTTPSPLQGIDGLSTAFPFMMPDGVTLYFAQKGEKSIGGYDLFVTRYDADKTTYLRPENIGMPFCSESNDYFYAVDEFTHLGYFVTDRRQPEGKVCVYTFIPNDTHKVYSADSYTEAQIRSLAAIEHIADTWGNGNARKEAMARLKRAQNMENNTIMPSPTPISALRHEANMLAASLQKARNYYATAPETERQMLRDEILKGEKELETRLRDIINEERKEQYQLNP